MKDMFYKAPDFNQPIGAWDISKVSTMYQMFYKATDFDQDLGWCTDADLEDFARDAPCGCDGCGNCGVADCPATPQPTEAPTEAPTAPTPGPSLQPTPHTHEFFSK